MEGKDFDRFWSAALMRTDELQDPATARRILRGLVTQYASGASGEERGTIRQWMPPDDEQEWLDLHACFLAAMQGYRTELELRKGAGKLER